MAKIKPNIRTNLKGNSYGRLKVIDIDLDRYIKGKPIYWKCICECGNEKSIRGTNLTHGKTFSCGCYNYEQNQKTINEKYTLGNGPVSHVIKELKQKKISFKEFCQSYGLSDKVVRNRLKKGWSPTRALTTPVDDDIVRRNKRSRTKGRKLEKFVADLLLKFYPEFDSEDIHPVGSAIKGIDIILNKYAREKIPISFECKNTVDFWGVKFLEQARKNAYPDTVPCVVWHEPNTSYEDSLITFDLKEFLRWYKDNSK